MSTVVDAERYRPTHHFSPRHGWMNDPNGLIRVDGLWHAFFQYYPDRTTHGPMHWGHATTPDLVAWTEHPVALCPDANGTCFSGSAIRAPSGDIELFYTAHRVDENGDDLQTQCVAHASQDMTSFSKDPGNPIVPNPGLRAFRDPKVTWHEKTGRWIMVLTHGQSIGFYSSIDRRNWSLESTFGETDGRHSNGPWECPDLVELRGPDGRAYSILIVGIGDGAFGGGSGTQYFVGEFDGHRFRNLNGPELTLWLDHGRDFYAAQSFFDDSDHRPLVLGWASNWQYARQTPTKQFRGAFALPRQLQLLQTPSGLRVSARVPADVVGHFEELEISNGGAIPRSGAYRLTQRVSSGETLSVFLFAEAVPQITLLNSVQGISELRLVRSSPHAITEFDHEYSVPLVLPARDAVLEVFVDNGLVEVCIDAGATWATSLNFPSDPLGSVRLEHK